MKPNKNTLLAGVAIAAGALPGGIAPKAGANTAPNQLKTPGTDIVTVEAPGENHGTPSPDSISPTLPYAGKVVLKANPFNGDQVAAVSEPAGQTPTASGLSPESSLPTDRAIDPRYLDPGNPPRG